jgi:hypothetical protein
MKKSTRPRKGKIINGWTVFGIYEILAASAGRSGCFGWKKNDPNVSIFGGRPGNFIEKDGRIS